MNQPVGGARPRTVTLAVLCLVVSLAIGTSILAFAWGFPQQAMLMCLVIGLLILGVALRQNWARWVLTAVTVIGLATTGGLLRFQLTYNLTVGSATVAQVLLELLGCGLLFLPQSGAWYRRASGGGSV